jgi:hypothetical protein
VVAPHGVAQALDLTGEIRPERQGELSGPLGALR